jgi:hypothetical protein
VRGDADLPQVVHARDSTGSLTGGLHCWQQEPNERRDDRDHYKELYESEGMDGSEAGRPMPTESIASD